MGNKGRFGKYGEIKRLQRLRQAGRRPTLHESQERQAKRRRSPKAGAQPKEHTAVRPARADDADFVGRLGLRVFTVYGPYEETISQWFLSGRSVTLIALSGRRPVGFAMIGEGSPGGPLPHEPELLAIAVEPEYQQKGIGRTLLKEIERLAAGKGATRLFLHTATDNLPARRLFTANGYRPLEIRGYFYPAGQDALIMFKDLA